MLFIVSACKSTVIEPKVNVVEFGKTIEFDFAAGFDNGSLFETTFENAAIEAGIHDPNINYNPVRMVYGKDPLILGLGEALLGMKVEEIKNIRLPPNMAYGEKINDSLRVISKDNIDNIENLTIDDIVTIVTSDNKRINAYVKEIGEESITVDLNHPLAGHFVQFSIIVKSIG